jgi:5'-methylthioadenosine phosphorylase
MRMSAQDGGWHIGVIGGSGLSAGVGLEDAQEIPVRSPFGEPSGPVTQGTLAGVKFSFLARHGTAHAIPPGAINYCANIDALKRCGVTDVVALSAIGSLREGLAPGHFVTADQFIDRTTQRINSFFGPGLVAHVSLADPVCPRLSALVATAAEAAGGTVHRAGCYVAIEGPQFSTRAESLMYRSWGADVIGMTAMPEARLAREAQLPYALLAMVTDYDCWHETEADVAAHNVFAVLAANAARARAAVRALAQALPARREGSPIDTALHGAFATAPEQRDPRLVAMLGAVLGRALD